MTQCGFNFDHPDHCDLVTFVDNIHFLVKLDVRAVDDVVKGRTISRWLQCGWAPCRNFRLWSITPTTCAAWTDLKVEGIK